MNDVLMISAGLGGPRGHFIRQRFGRAETMVRVLNRIIDAHSDSSLGSSKNLLRPMMYWVMPPSVKH